MSYTLFSGPTLETLNGFCDQGLLKGYLCDADAPEVVNQFDFWGSVFFSLTIATTIGYGTFCPVTDEGKLAVAIYAIFGIGFVGAALAIIGQITSVAIEKAYSGAKTHALKKAKAAIAKAKAKAKATKAKKAASGDASGIASDNGSSKKIIKVSSAIEKSISAVRSKRNQTCISLFLGILIVLFATASALAFCFEPDWDFNTSLYFTFITITTIGLGDLFPSSNSSKLVAFAAIMLLLPLMATGISLLSTILGGGLEVRFKKDRQRLQSLRAAVAVSLKARREAKEARAAVEAAAAAEKKKAQSDKKRQIRQEKARQTQKAALPKEKRTTYRKR